MVTKFNAESPTSFLSLMFAPISMSIRTSFSLLLDTFAATISGVNPTKTLVRFSFFYE